MKENLPKHSRAVKGILTKLYLTCNHIKIKVGFQLYSWCYGKLVPNCDALGLMNSTGF